MVDGQNSVLPFFWGADNISDWSIVDVEVGEKGPTSDIALFRQQQQKFADTQGFSGDKAYAGAERTTTPHKKPRKGELTAEQLSDNKIISSQRIFIEHVIRLLKIFRVAKERFRLHPSSYEQVILTICGLVRLRIGTLIFPVKICLKQESSDVLALVIFSDCCQQKLHPTLIVGLELA